MSAGYHISALEEPQAFVPIEGEVTGMVFCPQRLSGIAVGRCGQYQKKFGCQFGCKNAATPKQIAAALAALRIAEPREGAAERYGTCILCGEPKPRTKNPVGRCCSNDGKGAKLGAAQARRTGAGR